MNKHGVWVPHQLSEANIADRLRIATELLQRLEIEGPSFFDRILTCDEKWVLYVNIVRRKEWVNKNQKTSPTAKAGLHPKKVLLCVWWDTEGKPKPLCSCEFVIGVYRDCPF